MRGTFQLLFVLLVLFLSNDLVHAKNGFEIYQDALNAYGRGNFGEAERNVNIILKAVPSNAEATQLLGLIKNAIGDKNEAVRLLKKAAELKPVAEFHTNLAIILFSDLQRYDEAVEEFQKAIALEPNNDKIRKDLAVILMNLDRTDDALRLLEAGIKLQPKSSVLLAQMGFILANKDRFIEAEPWFEKAIAAAPNNPDIMRDLAETKKILLKFDEAEKWIEKGLKQSMGAHPRLLQLKGKLLRAKQDLSGAISSLERAIRLSPDCVECLTEAGLTLIDMHNRGQMGAVQKGEEYLARAVKLNPNDATVLMSYGFALLHENRFDELVSVLQHAVTVHPNNEEAWSNLGHALERVDELDAAMQAYAQMFRVHSGIPDISDSTGLLALNTTAHTAAWKDFNAAMYWLKTLVEHEAKIGGNALRLAPPTRMHLPPDYMKELAKMWVGDMANTAVTQFALQPFVHSRDRSSRRLRIGYIGNDFRGSHPVCHLVAEFFGHHDRDKFDITAYSSGLDDGTLCRQYVVEHADNFVDITFMSDGDVAKRIYEDKIDILVDLIGHTWGPRLNVLALRPAPVQAHYIGYASTTGATFIDYYLGDAVCIPPELSHHFTENVVYLPNGYWVHGDVNLNTIPPFKPEDRPVELPPNTFVFSAFNQVYKMDPIVFGIWMSILRRVPNSVLWVNPSPKEAVTNLHKEAAAHGIDPARVIFAPRADKEQHLARLRHADLMVDTFIYNGHTTTSDALMVGLPSVTLALDAMPRRVAASILVEAAEPQLIAASMVEFEELAVWLATHPEELVATRDRLLAKAEAHSVPLMDSKGLTRDIERAYEMMWGRYVHGLNPEPIFVS